MALTFALRSRIRMREEPAPTRADWVPPIALPVAAYWVVMGLLTYGVSKGPSGFSLGDARDDGAALGSTDFQAPAARVTADEAIPVDVRAPPRPNAMVASSTVALAPSPPEARPIAPESPRIAPFRGGSVRVQAFHDLQHTEDSRRWQASSDESSESVRDEAPPSSSHRAHEDAPSLPLRHVHKDDPPRPSQNDPPSPAFHAPLPAVSVASCESVLAAANDEMDLTAARGVPDLSRDAYAAVLENGAYLSSCAVPDGMALDVCAAVRGGRPVGVTVVTHPTDGRVSACVRRAVASLGFPKNPRLDVTRTRFDAVRPR
jgi:hypothetical protein